MWIYWIEQILTDGFIDSCSWGEVTQEAQRKHWDYWYEKGKRFCYPTECMEVDNDYIDY